MSKRKWVDFIGRNLCRLPIIIPSLLVGLVIWLFWEPGIWIGVVLAAVAFLNTFDNSEGHHDEGPRP